jgi:hypothetical protein
MRTAGDAALPVLATEVGWPSFGSDLRWGTEGVRRHHEPASASASPGSSGTPGSRDADPGNAFDHSGLVRLDADGRIVAKPALRAWREVVRRELARR